MSDCNTSKRSGSEPLQQVQADELQWVEIFASRVAEDLKQVLQEDMDWMTSHPILERLNRLRDAERARLEAMDPHAASASQFRKAS